MSSDLEAAVGSGNGRENRSGDGVSIPWGVEGDLAEKGGLGSAGPGPCMSSQGAHDFECHSKALGTMEGFKQGHGSAD